MIYTIVLSAGASTRMGQPKALVQSGDGRTFVQRIADTARAAGASGVVVVLGPPHQLQIGRALPSGVGRSLNPRPERGMLSSVQAGLADLPASTTAALIWPVDVPYVRVETVRALLDATSGKVVVPYVDRPDGARGGHPIRIPRRRFTELMALDAERGLKGLLDSAPHAVERLRVDDPGILLDIDTPEDLRHATAPRV